MTRVYTELEEVLDTSVEGAHTSWLDLRDVKVATASGWGETGTHNSVVIEFECSPVDTGNHVMVMKSAGNQTHKLSGEDSEKEMLILCRFMRATVKTAQAGTSTMRIFIQGK